MSGSSIHADDMHSHTLKQAWECHSNCRFQEADQLFHLAISGQTAIQSLCLWGTSLRFRGQLEEAKQKFLEAFKESQLIASLEGQLGCSTGLTAIYRECQQECDRSAWLQRALSLHFRIQPHEAIPECLQLELIYDQKINQETKREPSFRLVKLLDSTCRHISNEAQFLEDLESLAEPRSHRFLEILIAEHINQLRQSGQFSLMFSLIEEQTKSLLARQNWTAAIEGLRHATQLAFDCNFHDKNQYYRELEFRLKDPSRN